MQKNESGGLSLSLLLSKITFNFSIRVNVYEFILNYDKLFLPRSDKLVFGDKRLHHWSSSDTPKTSHQESKNDQDTSRGEVRLQPPK